MGFEKYLPIDAARDLPLDPHLHQWLSHLDLDFYRHHSHDGGLYDLKDLSDRDLTLHFLQRGFAEGRPYNRKFLAFFDAKHYAESYPELGLADAAQARRHWMYHGVFEGRIPNRMTQDLLDADVHLFQMGKVASKSIEKALVRAGHRRLIPHLHWASEIVQSYSQSFLSYDEIIRRDPHKELVFISGVRDPIERVVSGLFQSASESKSSLGMDELAAMFQGPREQLEAHLMPHLQLVLDWFSHGFFRGIDVYEHPFDTTRGHACIRQGPVSVFLYRYDALDRCWEPLSTLLGLRLVPESTNEGRAKGYGAQMQEALQVVRSLPHGALHEAVRGSLYWQHFFAGTAGARPGPAALSHGRAVPATGSAGNRLPGPATAAAVQCAAPAAARADRWVRIDLAVRTALRPPPLCRLRLDGAPDPCAKDDRGEAIAPALRTLPVQIDAEGNLRYYLRVPATCHTIVLQSADACADLCVRHFSVRPWRITRVLFDALRFEWTAGPTTLLRKCWRALRAARVRGLSTLGGFFLDNLERDNAGYGFACVSHPFLYTVVLSRHNQGHSGKAEAPLDSNPPGCAPVAVATVHAPGEKLQHPSKRISPLG